jgi:hypothetical protein
MPDADADRRAQHHECDECGEGDERQLEADLDRVGQVRKVQHLVMVATVAGYLGPV